MVCKIIVVFALALRTPALLLAQHRFLKSKMEGVIALALRTLALLHARPDFSKRGGALRNRVGLLSLARVLKAKAFPPS